MAKKDEVKIKQIENEEEEVKEEKPKKDKKEKKDDEKSLFSKIMNIVLWVIVLGWMAICVTDYLRTNNEKEPLFCIKEETKSYDDGTVYICTGPGYKYFEYKRDSYNAYQFGGIWVKEHDPFKE